MAKPILRTANGLYHRSLTVKTANTIKYIFLISALAVSVFTSCQGNAAVDKATSKDTVPAAKPPYGGARHQSKGSLSFKANGTGYEADPAHVKAFANAQVPLAMMLSKSDNGLSVSFQIRYNGKGEYKIDRDSKGTVGFTINGKMYWVVNASSGDYLDIAITDTKEIGTLILLSGTFEGVLEDREGNKVTITDGKFTTESV
jgi:hypothetical protein